MKDLKTDKILNFLIRFSYLSIIFLVPIYFGVFFESAHPFDFQKMIIFKILLFTLIFFSTMKFAFFPGFKKILAKVSVKYFYIFFIILIFSLITISWSVDPKISFYGSLDRQMGWLNEFYFFLFFIFLSLNIIISKNKDKKIRGILKIIVISSSLVSLYAVFQFFGLDFVIWDEPAIETRRAMSTLGQPNFLGSFILLTIPFAAYLFTRTNNFYYKIIYALSFLVQILALIFSGSRGAWIAFLVASFLVLLLFFYQKNKVIFFSGITGIILLLLILFFGGNSMSQRFQSAFDVSQGSSAVRAYIWSASLNSLEKKDWGYGLENQKEALWEYYKSDLAINNKINVIFDRSHNLFLDTALTIGLIGLFLWLWFYYFIFKLSIKNIKEDKYPLLSLLVFWSIFAYLISLLFNFSVTVTHLYFLIMVSLLVGINFSLEELDFSRKKWGNIIFKKIFLLILLLLCSFGTWIQIKNINNDYYFLKFKQFFSYQEFPSAIVTFSYLLEEGSNYQEYYYQFIDIIFDNFYNLEDITSKYIAKEQVEKVLIELENDHKNNSFSYKMAKAQSLAILGRLIESEQIFQELILLSPEYPDFYFKKAKKEIYKEDFVSAKKYLDKTLELIPAEEDVSSEINLNALKIYKERVESDVYFVDGFLNN
jgi:O-antigen ligase